MSIKQTNASNIKSIHPHLHLQQMESNCRERFEASYSFGPVFRFLPESQLFPRDIARVRIEAGSHVIGESLNFQCGYKLYANSDISNPTTGTLCWSKLVKNYLILVKSWSKLVKNWSKLVKIGQK